MEISSTVDDSSLRECFNLKWAWWKRIQIYLTSDIPRAFFHNLFAVSSYQLSKLSDWMNCSKDRFKHERAIKSVLMQFMTVGYVTGKCVFAIVSTRLLNSRQENILKSLWHFHSNIFFLIRTQHSRETSVRVFCFKDEFLPATSSLKAKRN